MPEGADGVLYFTFMDHTLLIGNGLNLLSGSEFLWDKVLDNCKNEGCSRLGVDKNPNPFSYTHQYEDIFLNSKASNVRYQNGNVKKNEDILKGSIIRYLSGLKIKNETKNVYESLLELTFKNILTTNYDSILEDCLEENHFKIKKSDTFVTEKTYSVNRRHVWNNQDDMTLVVWPIHGEMNNLHTVMLGYNHYCGSVTRLNEYINKGQSNVSKERNADVEQYQKWKDGKKATPSYMKFHLSTKGKRQETKFWADTFFTTDVHILGLGMYFEEIDLWWLLNKRLRLKRDEDAHDWGLNYQIKNKIYAYGYYKSEVKELLNAFDVDVSYVTTRKPSNNARWLNLYKNNLKRMRKNIQDRKEK